ncbi:hypothetical protein BASA60_008783 [Batrachochytrium salamandrivorans]|nr:hypothetical protein BASA60_008783 [Batrachochytrium salamandrivorans]
MGIMDAESLSSSGASSGGNGHLGDIDPNMPKQPVRKSSDRKKVVLSEPASHSSRKGKIPSTLMIVMEYADGGTLSDYLESLQESGTRMEIHEIMNLFCQIGLALNHIHSLNILHRDLKTNNILVSGCGRYKVLKIGDLAFLKSCLLLPVQRQWWATPAYISPELCEGKP